MEFVGGGQGGRLRKPDMDFNIVLHFLYVFPDGPASMLSAQEVVDEISPNVTKKYLLTFNNGISR